MSAGDRTDVLPTGRPVAGRRELTLLVVEGPLAGQRVTVGEAPLVLGKDPAADLTLPDAAVSRRHCVLEPTESGHRIKDLGSTNGTFVDGIRITEAFLRIGARIKVGNVVLLFQPIYASAEVGPSDATTFGSLVGRSLVMRQIFGLFERVAPTDATLLLTGETGTGKGAAARAVHDHGNRKDGPFVVFDCGAVSPTLIEGELFGAEKGAYTGAVAARAGACEEADGGTLFLDEIDDLPLELQPKLLRVLEEREVRRLGSHKPRKLDLRVIAASKVDLEVSVKEGRFREDLYFRLAVVRVDLPPLRDRTDDLPLLADRFLGEAGAWEGLSPTLREQLGAHTWPGNLRELRNILDRLRYLGLQEAEGVALGGPAAAAREGGTVSEADYLRPFKEAKESLLEAFEREYLERLLERAGGKIAVAAREAHLNRKYFYDLLKKHGLYQKDRGGEP
ncbi:MAG: sigma 54-interacting transcriptional regulator [Deltaproteobacteria bacterium]|nr:sigma 54-interacting transcriptional regulator [Deltaproteobacteria bacterium]